VWQVSKSSSHGLLTLLFLRSKVQLKRGSICLEKLAKNARHFPWRGFYRVYSRPTLQYVLRWIQFKLSRSIFFTSVVIFSSQLRLDLSSDLKALHAFFSHTYYMPANLTLPDLLTLTFYEE
jgi:hypothetical protein